MERNAHGKYRKIKKINSTSRKFDNVKISVLPDEVAGTERKNLRKKLKTNYGAAPNHENSTKRKVSSKCYQLKKFYKPMEKRFSDLNDTSEMKQGCKNAYYKQTEDFLYFHLSTVSNCLLKLLDHPNNSLRKPTDLERLEVGLPSLVHCSKRKRSNIHQGDHSADSHLKKLKLYLPFKQYWTCNIPDIIPSAKFDKAVRKLPTSFNWLVGVCARLIETDKNVLLREVLYFEQTASGSNIVP